MCIEDIAVSRRSNYQRHTVTGGTPITLPADQQRLALIAIVNATVSGRVAISELLSDVVGGFGASVLWSNVVTANDILSTVSMRMDYKTHPSLIHSRLFVSTTFPVIALLEVSANSDLQVAVDRYLKKLLASE